MEWGAKSISFVMPFLFPFSLFEKWRLLFFVCKRKSVNKDAASVTVSIDFRARQDGKTRRKRPRTNARHLLWLILYEKDKLLASKSNNMSLEQLKGLHSFFDDLNKRQLGWPPRWHNLAHSLILVLTLAWTRTCPGHVSETSSGIAWKYAKMKYINSFDASFSYRTERGEREPFTHSHTACPQCPSAGRLISLLLLSLCTET